MPKHVNKGDMVEIIAGLAKGNKGKVLKVLTKTNRVIVEGQNMASKHIKPSQQNPQGGRINIERPIHISNVLPIAPGAEKGTRVRFETKDGVKTRVSTDGKEISVVSKKK